MPIDKKSDGRRIEDNPKVDDNPKKWNHISTDLSDSMKNWADLESNLKGSKSAEDIKLQEMRDLIQRIQSQLESFK